ncbi:MAG: sugar ABC transporter permease [Armatimonadetes bacterium]|nr:sugar ABC transporter permease [Armatimonadota bacterium]
MDKEATREAKTAYLLVAPSLIVIGVIALFPILRSLWMSFYAIDLTLPQLGRPFVGLANYLEIFTDSRFWAALWNTTYFTVISVTLELVLGLAIAMLVNRPFAGRGLLRASVLIPWAIPTVVSAQMWRWIFNDKAGILGSLLQNFKILSEPYPWLASVETARLCIIAADVWKTTPFMVLLLLAGLQTISPEYYEAAMVDGATPFRRFLHVTLPLLKPIILVALLFRTLDAFRIFDLVYVLTGGAFKTETLSVLTSDVTFKCSDYGQGSALAVVMFCCIMVISFIFIKVLGAKVEE